MQTPLTTAVLPFLLPFLKFTQCGLMFGCKSLHLLPSVDEKKKASLLAIRVVTDP